MVKSVVFEGGECCGKSTIVSMLQKYFQEHHIDAVFSREPGSTKIGEQIRNVILDVNNTEMDYDCEVMLYAAARAQNLKEVVRPAIDAGRLVILDRFVESSYVYQGLARGVGFERVKAINDIVLDGWEPDVTILLEIAPEDAMKRIALNPDREVNRLDLEKMDFMHKVHDGYMLRAKQNPRYRIVDANQTPDKILEDVLQIIGV